MKVYVTDTHAPLWHLSRDPALSAPAADIFHQADAGAAEIIIPSIVLVEVVYLCERQRVPDDRIDRILALPGMPGSHLDHEGYETQRKPRKPFVLFVPFRVPRGPSLSQRLSGSRPHPPQPHGAVIRPRGQQRTVGGDGRLDHEGYETRRKPRKPFALFVPFRVSRGPSLSQRLSGSTSHPPQPHGAVI